VEPDAAEVDGPHEVGDVGDDERPRGGAVDGPHVGGGQPVRSEVGDALLEEALASGPVGEPLHHHGAVTHLAHDLLLDGEVVAHEVELGLAACGEEHLGGAADPDQPSCGLDLDRAVVLRRSHRVRLRLSA